MKNKAMTFRKISPFVEAVQLFPHSEERLIEFVEYACRNVKDENGHELLMVNTSEGPKYMKIGDYAVKDGEGNITVWEGGLFEETFEYIEEV